ncbi:MAG: serine hydrolase, partial [Saprospiraceae bacterium]
MKKSLWFIKGAYLILACSCSTARFSTDRQLDVNLQKNHFFKSILDSFNKYESQIIFTQINRDEVNKPIFKSHTWNLKPEFYFYPASMVKMPAALIAVEKINRLQALHPELNLFTPVRYEAGQSPQTSFLADSSSWNHDASIGHFIKKIFLVSDNEAFNRTYEFIGQAELNQRLKELGYSHTHIIHRLDAPDFDYEANKYTNPLTFAQEDKMIYKQKELYNPKDVRIPNLESLQKGTDY